MNQKLLTLAGLSIIKPTDMTTALDLLINAGAEGLSAYQWMLFLTELGITDAKTVVKACLDQFTDCKRGCIVKSKIIPGGFVWLSDTHPVEPSPITDRSALMQQAFEIMHNSSHLSLEKAVNELVEQLQISMILAQQLAQQIKQISDNPFESPKSTEDVLKQFSKLTINGVASDA